jgi:hypothetical protein
VVDTEQEQAQSTQECYSSGGIHGPCLDASFSNVEQNHFKKIYRAKQRGKQIQNPNIEIRNKLSNK